MQSFANNIYLIVKNIHFGQGKKKVADEKKGENEKKKKILENYLLFIR